MPEIFTISNVNKKGRDALLKYIEMLKNWEIEIL
jgi:hypothetical protein